MIHAIRSISGTGWLQTEYDYAQDGSVKDVGNGHTDSSGGVATFFAMKAGPGVDGTGASETTLREVVIDGHEYDYFYDSRNRRRFKADANATSLTDEYFYDNANEMLVDQGHDKLNTAATYYTTDDYVWLGGRPVAILRGNLSTAYVRRQDSSTFCGRNMASSKDQVACGAYFLVTDPVGRPVVMLDSNQYITGTGEYDPFGQVNRVPVDGETAHAPYGATTNFAQFVASNVGGTTTDIRVKMQSIDVANTNSLCGGSADRVKLIDVASPGTPLGSWTGKHLGTLWSPWETPTDSTQGLREDLTEGNPKTCSDPANCPATCGANSRTSALGAIAESFEYRRVQPGAVNAFWTPLREPGRNSSPGPVVTAGGRRASVPRPGGAHGRGCRATPRDRRPPEA